MLIARAVLSMETRDVQIEDGSGDDDDLDLMDFIETDRNLDEEKALVDPKVCVTFEEASILDTIILLRTHTRTLTGCSVSTSVPGTDNAVVQVQVLHDAVEEVSGLPMPCIAARKRSIKTEVRAVLSRGTLNLRNK